MGQAREMNVSFLIDVVFSSANDDVNHLRAGSEWHRVEIIFATSARSEVLRVSRKRTGLRVSAGDSAEKDSGVERAKRR